MVRYGVGVGVYVCVVRIVFEDEGEEKIYLSIYLATEEGEKGEEKQKQKRREEKKKEMK